MSKLVFDIETIGMDWDSLDETTQHNLSRWTEREARDEGDLNAKMKDLKEGLGFSPLTGEIVAIGVLDVEKDKGVVYYQSPDKQAEVIEEGNFKFKPGTEKEILENFWEGVKKYDEFISFNGRGFDVPFLMIRSAVHKIRASKDLMSNRYLNSQRFNATHIDLFDQLSFYGAVRRRGSLHLYCNTFGIKSPKAEGVTGDDVQKLFQAKEYLKIAKYNSGDLKATKELYQVWEKYIKV